MGPHWIKQWIADLAALNDQFRDDNGVVDFEALGREEYQFRMALITRKFSKSIRAKETFAKAKAAYDASVENGKKGGRPSLKQETIEETTAGAPNGNNGDCDHPRESASTDSTTACVNNSKGSARPSTDGDTRKDSHGHARAGNRVTLESGTSVEKSTQNDQRRTGGHLIPSSSLNSPPVRSGAVDVLSLAYSGEFGNVKLTQEQYSELGIKFGNMQKLNRAIDSLSCKLENEEIKPVPKNHYAVLLKWASYREDMDEKKELEESKPKMTNMEKSWIAAMKRVEEM